MRYALVFLLLLAGCTEAVTMYNPNTGQTVKCGPYPIGTGDGEASAMREAKCIDDFKAQGFQRQP